MWMCLFSCLRAVSEKETNSVVLFGRGVRFVLSVGCGVWGACDVCCVVRGETSSCINNVCIIDFLPIQLTIRCVFAFCSHHSTQHI